MPFNKIENLLGWEESFKAEKHVFHLHLKLIKIKWMYSFLKINKAWEFLKKCEYLFLKQKKLLIFKV